MELTVSTQVKLIPLWVHKATRQGDEKFRFHSISGVNVMMERTVQSSLEHHGIALPSPDAQGGHTHFT